MCGLDEEGRRWLCGLAIGHVVGVAESAEECSGLGSFVKDAGGACLLDCIFNILANVAVIMAWHISRSCTNYCTPFF